MAEAPTSAASVPSSPAALPPASSRTCRRSPAARSRYWPGASLAYSSSKNRTAASPCSSRFLPTADVTMVVAGSKVLQQAASLGTASSTRVAIASSSSSVGSSEPAVATIARRTRSARSSLHTRPSSHAAGGPDIPRKWGVVITQLAGMAPGPARPHDGPTSPDGPATKSEKEPQR